MKHMRVSIFIAAMFCTVLLTAAPLQAARKTQLPGTERLLDLVRERGSIVVMVSVYLDEEWAPEAKLKPEKAKKQRDDLRKKKDELFVRNPKAAVLSGRDYASLPSFAAVVDEQALRQLIKDDGVESIRESRGFQLTLAQSVHIVRADVAADQGFGGANQVVAVIDTGLDDAHRFLNNKLRAGACFTTQYANGVQNATCPNVAPQLGNPHAPFALTETEIGLTSGKPCRTPAPGNTIPVLCGHGTRVAGIVAGRDTGTPSVGYTGVAPDAGLISVNVASLRACTVGPQCPDGWLVNIEEHDLVGALEYVYSIRASHSIAAVNLSLAFNETYATACDSQEPVLAQAINQLYAANIAVVGATGNDGGYAVRVPACIANVVAVGATTDDDHVAYYSNNAANVDLLAPGGDIVSIPPAGIRSSVPGGTFEEGEGTSFAVPHVAGAFAVLKQKAPAKTPAELLEALVQTGQPVTDHRPGAPFFLTKPRIDVGTALHYGDTEPPSVPGSFMATAQSSTSVSLAWFASTDNVGVTEYVIERRASRQAAWGEVWRGNQVGLLDTGVPGSTTYEYRIRALDAANNESSAQDIATTVMFEDDPIREPYDNGGTTIRGVHIGRLREAADAWRIFAGQSRLFTYGAQTGFVAASDLTAIITALNSARQQLGLQAFAYLGVTPPASGAPVDDNHVQELRDAMK